MTPGNSSPSQIQRPLLAPADLNSGHTMRAWRRRAPVLPQLVRTQAQQTPDAIAAVYEDQLLSYRELIRRSDQWASHLHQLGVTVGTMVGIHLDRSLDLPVIVLAVLEAGGVCVPLDPSHPAAALASLTQEARLSFILSERQLKSRLPSTHVPTIIVDSVKLSDRSAQLPSMTGSDLAFVLFTSGSTGVPKGVMIPHATVAARMYRPECEIPPASRCMTIMKTSISNSPFLGEMFAPLLHGCYFAIARPDGHQDIPYLGKLIIGHGVTHIAMTPTILRAFLDWPGASQCTSLKGIYCGGEAVTDDVRKRFFAQFGLAKLLVSYGTTEGGHALTFECGPDDKLDKSQIGRSIDGAQLHLLDPSLRPITNGEVGEMYLAGQRLASGYLNQPAATAEHFLPNPFSATPGDRLCRSGDLARLGPNSDIQFQGRDDQQVKILGNRVELAEIESVLAGCPGVRAAAVTVSPNNRDESQLTAYIVLMQHPAPEINVLRQHVTDRLPHFMVPNVFIPVQEIPLTLSGKVDRKLLSTIRPEDWSLASTGYLPPQTPTERLVAQIWEQVLGVEQVGVHDNFFALGGDSLRVARVAADIERQIGRQVSRAELFGAPNLEQLAQTIDSEQASKVALLTTPVQPKGTLPPLFLMPNMGGIPFISKDILDALGEERPIFAMGLAQDDPPWADHASLPEIASHFTAAIQEANVTRPHFLGWSFGGMLAYEVARQLSDTGVEVGLVAIIDTEPRIPTLPKETLSRNLLPFTNNLPRWFVHFAFKQTFSQRLMQIRRKTRSLTHRFKVAMSGQPTSKRLDGSMELRGVPDQLRQRMETCFHALHSYVPGPYEGHLVLLRAKTRPLFHGFSPDLNWGRLVRGRLEVINIPGAHGSILHSPNIERLSSQLKAVLAANNR